MNAKNEKTPIQSRDVDDDIAKANDESARMPSISDNIAKPEGMPDGMTWGEPPSDSGHAVPKVPLDDEESAAEQLVRGGAEAAQSTASKKFNVGDRE
ncbi:MAG: hypothetical protein ACAI35_07510 [Candidatus Methylacidiphilales bacterium]|nr:hypothetical protein [Candidatus Methylacidiphilales bacterium]